MVLPGRVPPAEMYPAGVPELRARFVVLPSGLRVRVVEAGEENAPAIVLVRGWACGAWVFHENIPALAKAGFRAVAVELKGHGLSDKPESPLEYTVESMRDHLIAIGIPCVLNEQPQLRMTNQHVFQQHRRVGANRPLRRF